MPDKETVILVQGHLYTFFSNGVYLCEELLAFYNVVLVVPKNFHGNKQFQKISDIMSFKDIIYFSSNVYVSTEQKDRFYGLNIIKQLMVHFEYSEMSYRLISKFKPIAVIQHDYIHAENMYFFHWANYLQPNSKKITVLSTAPSNRRTLSGFQEARRNRTLKLVRSNKILGRILYWLVNSYKLLESLIRNIIVPILVLKRTPYYGLSRFDNIDIKPKKILFDYFMVFEDAEEKFYGQLFDDSATIKRILSPIGNGALVKSHLVSVKNDKKGIVVFFSLTGAFGFDSNLLDRWCAFVSILSKKYADDEVIIKLHPGYSLELCIEIKSYIQQKCKWVDIIASKEDVRSSESLILNSWLVIGDSSSVLPWATYCGEKTVLSMDVGNSLNSKDMECYSGITMFSRDDDFVRIVDNIAPTKISDRRQSSLPNLTDLIR